VTSLVFIHDSLSTKMTHNTLPPLERFSIDKYGISVESIARRKTEENSEDSQSFLIAFS
jgi:hypothetical protein